MRSNDLLIDGDFEYVDAGNPLRRVIIGFGSGAANLKTRARVFQGTEQQKILEFNVTANSGKFPGAFATAPAVVAAPASVAAMATPNAEQTARYLSEFFSRHRVGSRPAKPRKHGSLTD